MLILDDDTFGVGVEGVELVRPFRQREITHAIHDIDGTYSLIRDWPPVMSLVLYMVANERLNWNQSVEIVGQSLLKEIGHHDLPETDRFCVESAGLSALTQMEWAVRRGLENGKVHIPNYEFSKQDSKVNGQIIEAIWKGQERFENFNESEVVQQFIAGEAPKLFRLYEYVLNGACRDRNLQIAQTDPQQFLVPGAMFFMDYLHQKEVKNYFVTGAVVDKSADTQNATGIHEEVLVLGFQIGAGQTIESISGSAWDCKIPKVEMIRHLCETLEIDSDNLLIVGDGRAEVAAGVELGAVVVSRLSADQKRQRQIHKSLGANIIIENYICLMDCIGWNMDR